MRPYAVFLLFAPLIWHPMLFAAEEFNAAAVGTYQEPGFNENHDYSGNHQVDSVDPFTGALKILVRDLRIPGNGGLDIEVVRNYQSVTNTVGPYSTGYTERTPYGTGWDMHFGRVWVSEKYKYLNAADNNRGCQIGQPASNLNPILELPDGSKQVLANGDGNDFAFISKSRWIGRCLPTSENTGDGGLVVFSPAGIKYVFNLMGTVSPDKQLRSYFVTRIEDADGNNLKFTYNIGSSNKLARHHLLKKITSSDGRVVDFTYSDEGGPKALLAGISANGRTISYGYTDASWNVGATPQYLTTVNHPDGTRWLYSYNNANSLVGINPGRFSLVSMTSPNGLQTRYEYDFLQMGTDPAEKLNVIKRRVNVGLVGMQTGDLTWDYQYSKGYYPNNDQTLEKGPLQCITYEHVGASTIPNGASNVDQGLWKIGTLVRKSIAARSGTGCGVVLRNEVYTWDRQDISSQKEMRRLSLLVENSTRAPLLSQRVINQAGMAYTTRYSYDAYGQPSSVSEQGQRSRTLSYTYVRPNGRWMLGKVSIQSTSGIPGTVGYSYTSTGRISQKSLYGVVTNYTYTVNGDLASEADGNGNTSRQSDYYRGVPRRTQKADGGVTLRSVNASGTLDSITDPLGRTTRYAYDAMDRVTLIQLPKSSLTRYDINYEFSTSGLKQTATRAGYTIVRQFNALGYLINQQEMGGASAIVSNAVYQADGHKVFSSFPGYGAASTSGERFEYDAIGRVISVRHSDGSSQSTSYGLNNVETYKDERGSITNKFYSSFGDPDDRSVVRFEQPEGVVTVIGRDNIDRVTSIEQGGLTRTYTYDSRGLLASEFNPETQLTAYSYDSAGNVVTRKVGGADVDRYSYDSLNRLVLKSLPAGQNFTFEYDLGGRLVKQSSYQGATWSYVYNAHDQVISEALSLTNPSRSWTIGYGYNALDQLHTITYPSGMQVFYDPDVYGRPRQVGTFASGVTHYANGDLQSLVFANGRSLTIGQDTSTLRATDRRVGGLPQFFSPMAQRYTYDQSGNLTQLIDEIDPRYSQSMQFDNLNRLVGSGGIWNGAVFRYNNRNDLVYQSIAGRQLEYWYDTQGRLASISGSMNFGLSYNNRGNTTQGRSRYTYDNANQMQQFCISPQWECSNPTESYIYDARGYRSVTTFSNGIQAMSLYGQEGRLLREDYPSDGGFVEHVYLDGERIASRMQCEFVDSNGNGISDCEERRYPVSGILGAGL
ncbi:RHS repeat protein [Pseudomonas sp. PDNC002]|uniref:RHS repeat protein n=1 Tax=Pseudomonas sp. PDNC002 TaxID=2811422 RepID=UPI0019639B9A|nr:RHS repeat protein [Pseudomonas sp. PDNC002]QRY80305.1 RHS repeat protein [Pseudomonas sp. PDNC002]